MRIMQNRVHLLGVPIDTLTRGEVVERLMNMCTDGAQHHVLTPNSEMLRAAVRNKNFYTVLSNGDLNIPDSAGLLLMARYTGQRIPERVTGVDTVRQFCAGLSSGHPVFFQQLHQ